MENPFSLKRKAMEKTPNNFIIIKSIKIILVYVSRLKKNLFFFFFSLTHTLIISFKGGNTLLSPPWLSSRRRQPFALFPLAIFLKAAIPYTLLPLAFLLSENLFSLSWFHALFSLAIFLKVAIPFILLPLVFLLSKNLFSLFWFHALFFFSLKGELLGQKHQILWSIVYL